ncbi:family 16 glycosylhydrolase [Actinomadura sp. 6N118]|uniref:glycoside hydrolase family 16 protein n=1 Tax=Actinomadura sp. 6N118 TaxID=3375151 RepID=UPI0037BB25D5
MRRHLRTLGMIIMVLACGTVAVMMNTGRLFGPPAAQDKTQTGAQAPQTGPAGTVGQSGARLSKGKMRLVWSDEFTGAAGSPPNPRRWKIETGSLGNGRLDYLTRRNVALDGKGRLVITALRQRAGKLPHTSARITTEGRFEPTYGRITARIKTPNGRGLWPAFWMLGTNFRQLPWPDCGEIDIMERRGHLRDRVDATLQGPGYSGVGLTRHYSLGPGGDFGAAFHTFTLDWRPNKITLYVDDHVVQTARPSTLPGRWVFNHPFFLVLNLAVGGRYAGTPDAQTAFPAQMVVDYVRAYQTKPR